MKRRVYKVQGRNGYYGVDEAWKGLDTTIRLVETFKSRKAAESYAANLNNAVADFITDNALDRQECCGFKNYETTSFALVIDNDRELLEIVLEQVKEAMESNNGREIACHIADMLMEKYESTSHIQFSHHDRRKTSIYEAWLQSAANKVDWLGLAEHYLYKLKDVKGVSV